MKNSLFLSKIIFSLILLFSFTNLFSQTKNPDKFNIGITANLGFSNPDLENSPTGFLLLRRRPGIDLAAGLKSQWRFTENWFLESGLIFGLRAYPFKNEVIFISGPNLSNPLVNITEEKIQLTRLSLPFSFKYCLTQKWRFFGGADLDFYLKKDRKREIDVDNPTLFEIATEINSFPIGAHFGFSYLFSGKRTNSEGSLIFNYTFNEFEIPESAISNRQLSIGIGFILWL